MVYPLETLILNLAPTIESWFRDRWLETPAPLMTSVDLRQAGFKLAPVDTNLFPAGFNNLDESCMPLCVQAIQAYFTETMPAVKKILILPESHTRNRFYLESVDRLRQILVNAGFTVHLGDLHSAQAIQAVNVGSALNFEPDLLLLNNDLSSGVPDRLLQAHLPILPPLEMGWVTRRKSTHFECYAQVAHEFSTAMGIDPWQINPAFSVIDDIDFMSQSGLDALAAEVDRLLAQVQQKYVELGILEKPFMVVKADNGTYGMSVMMIQDGAELLRLNRKQRTKMSASKGSQKVSRVMIQEGVHTFETVADGSVAEPVVYMLGSTVVGGFYRVHEGRGKNENLNAPGMHFQPLAFSGPCNCPTQSANRFYVYGVIARLAALAAGREMQLI